MKTFKHTINTKSPLEQAWNAGWNAGVAKAIKMFFTIALAMLDDAGWDQDEAQEFINRITNGMIYYSKHLDEYNKLEEEYKAKGIEAEGI